MLGGAESVDCYESSDGIDLPHVADEIVRLLVAADLDDAHFRFETLRLLKKKKGTTDGSPLRWRSPLRRSR